MEDRDYVKEAILLAMKQRLREMAAQNSEADYNELSREDAGYREDMEQEQRWV